MAAITYPPRVTVTVHYDDGCDPRVIQGFLRGHDRQRLGGGELLHTISLYQDDREPEPPRALTGEPPKRVYVCGPSREACRAYIAEQQAPHWPRYFALVDPKSLLGANQPNVVFLEGEHSNAEWLEWEERFRITNAKVERVWA